MAFVMPGVFRQPTQKFAQTFQESAEQNKSVLPSQCLNRQVKRLFQVRLESIKSRSPGGTQAVGFGACLDAIVGERDS